MEGKTKHINVTYRCWTCLNADKINAQYLVFNWFSFHRARMKIQKKKHPRSRDSIVLYCISSFGFTVHIFKYWFPQVLIDSRYFLGLWRNVISDFGEKYFTELWAIFKKSPRVFLCVLLDTYIEIPKIPYHKLNMKACISTQQFHNT